MSLIHRKPKLTDEERAARVVSRARARRERYKSTTPRIEKPKRKPAPSVAKGQPAKDWVSLRVEATRPIRHDLHKRPGLRMVACPGPAPGGVLIGSVDAEGNPVAFEVWLEWVRGCVRPQTAVRRRT